MPPTTVTGHVDERHRLIAEVPETVPPGPVTITIRPAVPEDEAEESWQAAIADAWADELSDSREDLYTLCDGEPVHEGE